MPFVLGVDADWEIRTFYARAFRERLVYSHGILGPGGYGVIRYAGPNAKQDSVTKAARGNPVEFITGSGHGSSAIFGGYNDEVIWDAASVSPADVSGRIVHLLACESGITLGPAMINAGARGFWGYGGMFDFYFADPPLADPSTDPIAEPFFVLDAIIDWGVLARADVSRIRGAVQDFVAQVYPQLLADAPVAAATLLDDYARLRFFGDPSAVLPVP